MPVPTLAGIRAETVTTARLTTRLLSCGDPSGDPILFLHGNASSATFWEETMLALPRRFRALTPDQRAYGDADPAKKIDATRGLADLSDDAASLLDHLNILKAHVVGHSLGGSVVWQMLMDHPERIITATVVCPGSPYGYGGTKDLDGTPCWDDFAGSGGGIVNAAFAERMKAGDRSTDNPQSAPRVVMNTFYWKPPFVPAREEDLLSSVLSAHVGAEDYPGDFVPSANWPFVAPGRFGPSNALSPKYNRHVDRLYAIDPKPPILWIRGSHDQIISDQSLFDVGTLGALGVIPGYPGAEVYPSQPMVGQTRAVLDKYQAAGGRYTEIVIDEAGHTPYIEKSDEFSRHFHAFIQT
ncbi:MAG: alpha/beta hydrolase [Phototrophicales bacterium]|nr:MAG: alpha/beta hydrolase [Phototrophicales bacterium]